MLKSGIYRLWSEKIWFTLNIAALWWDSPTVIFVLMVTVIKNEHFLSVAFGCSTMKPLRIWEFGMTLEKNHSSRFFFFIFPIFFLMLKNSRTSTWIGFKKKIFFPVEKKVAASLTQKPKPNHLIWQHNAQLPIWHSGWHTWRTLLCLPSGNDWAKRNAHFFVWKTTIDRRKRR